MEHINNLQDRINRMDGFYSSIKSRVDSLDKEVKNLTSESEILIKSSSVLKYLLDTMAKDEINKMAGLITYGLKTVFEDQDLTFIPVITKKKDKVYIELKTKNKDIEGEFGSFGGSVAVIESFLLRVLCMLKLNMARFMLLDETFASVGAEYIPNTSKLIGELSKKLNMDILLVTHQKEFQSNADHVYKVKESENGIEMEKIK